MQNSKRMPMGAFSEIKLRVSNLKNGESIIINDPKGEVKNKIFKKYREIIDESNKINSYKNFLRLVNFYISEGYFINSYIEFMIINNIEKEGYLRDIEKKYLLNKIDGFKYEYLNGLKNNNFNIFKISKKLLMDENLIYIIYNMKINDINYRKKVKVLKHYCNMDIFLDSKERILNRIIV